MLHLYTSVGDNDKKKNRPQKMEQTTFGINYFWIRFFFFLNAIQMDINIKYKLLYMYLYNCVYMQNVYFILKYYYKYYKYNFIFYYLK